MKRALILISILFCLSCEGTDIQIEEVTGIVLNTPSNSNTDACGWLIDINGTLYKPTYLPISYEQDNLRVSLKVEFLETQFSCNTAGVLLDELRIEQIRPE